MSWSRRGILALGALPLAGCFRPMLAEDGGAAALRGRIALPVVEDRFGFFLNESLESRLGRPGETDWRLRVKVDRTERGLAVAQDNSVTRITILVRGHWSLWQDGAEAAALSDTATTQAGYSATTSLFATRQTRRDIERRLARDLGERIARAVLARAGQIAT